MTDKTIQEAPPTDLKPGKRKVLRKSDPNEDAGNEFEEKFGAILRKNCKLSVATFKKIGKYLYRGSRDHGVAYMGRSTNKRRASDTPDFVQDNLNQLFLKAGYKAVRGNSIFTSGNENVAADYGDVYIIFPVDGFNFTWSSKIADLFSYYDRGGFLTGFDLAQNTRKYTKINDSFVRQLEKAASNNSSQLGYFHEHILYDDNGFTGKTPLQIKISRMLSKWQGEYAVEFDKLFIDPYNSSPDFTLAEELFRIRKYHIKKETILYTELVKEAIELTKFDKTNNVFDNKGRQQLSKIIAKSISIIKMLKEYDKLTFRIFKEISKKPTSNVSAESLEKLGFMNNKNFAWAIASKNEIYINGLYYAFDIDTYYKAIRSWLKKLNK